MNIGPFLAAGLLALPAAALAQLPPQQMPPQAGQQLPAPDTAPASSSNPDGTVGGDTLEPVQTAPADALPRPMVPGDPGRLQSPSGQPGADNLSNPVRDQKIGDEIRRQEQQPE
jgi:hypothetical protein